MSSQRIHSSQRSSLPYDALHQQLECSCSASVAHCGAWTHKLKRSATGSYPQHLNLAPEPPTRLNENAKSTSATSGKRRSSNDPSHGSPSHKNEATQQHEHKTHSSGSDYGGSLYVPGASGGYQRARYDEPWNTYNRRHNALEPPGYGDYDGRVERRDESTSSSMKAEYGDGVSQRSYRTSERGH